MSAGDSITDANNNVAIGTNALHTNQRGIANIAIGREALASMNPSGAVSTYNTAVGADAGYAVTTGVQNVLIGGLTGDALTDADQNVAVGFNALSADTKGSKSVAIGRESLVTQNFTSATDTYNTAVGYNTGQLLTIGVQNTLIGGLAGDALTDADYNVAVGYGALITDTLGSRNTAIGRYALASQNSTSATDSYNTSLDRDWETASVKASPARPPISVF